MEANFMNGLSLEIRVEVRRSGGLGPSGWAKS